ncbi:Membrane protein involved in the export of O-antigen and teichoic acid [Desulfocicer vacuolatum DSM 3385]|uniref:Membrane protein involved in the export of O-antigen and teichoic acid n=1 Tax=Desulfocicer vacuolatum DSM 3385 TaxID=1121400 RepID=A0A1W2BKH3_9BACT|nr:flippase [Desulfocicer vacuolatum]SMC73028.1 Membrane protein involved in the export of O-antigen and teichoic acid [Desulfocicer vacuolatum DSM 3385]
MRCKFFNKFRLYIRNTSWILGGYFFRLLTGFFVLIFIARYLGPKKFGILSYAGSLTAIFATTAHMGLNGLVVRELVKKIDVRNEILGSAVALKCCGAFFGFFLICIVAINTEDINSPSFWVIVIIASSLLFKPSEIFAFWFEAHVQAKYTSIASVISHFFTGSLNIFLVVFGANLYFFAFANLFQAFVFALLLWLFYCRYSDLPIQRWLASFRKSKELLGQSWIVFLGSIFANVYLKIDQVMLKWMIGAKEVGIYSVASTLSEIWYFMPVAIMASFYPRLIKLHESKPDVFKKRFQQLLNLLSFLALIVILLVTLMAKPFVDLFYGVAYQASSAILIVHIWASIFVFMRAAFSKWILIENVLMFSLITQGFGAIINICSNFLLIPKYGGSGAALATLASYAMASYFSLLFYQKSRPIFWMMTRSLIAPVIYFYAMIRRVKWH